MPDPRTELQGLLAHYAHLLAMWSDAGPDGNSPQMELIATQARWAALLNILDGGARHAFTSWQEWVDRLKYAEDFHSHEEAADA